MSQTTYSVELIRSMLTTLQDDIEDDVTWNALHDYLIENELIPSWERYSHVKDTRLIDAMLGCKAIASRQGKSRIEDIHIYSEYAEPGYSHCEMGVAVGNWNGITSFQPATQRHGTIDDSPEILGNILEKIGLDLQWSDEWYSCCHCDGLVRCEPDYYWWQPFYELYEGEVTCNRCLQSQRSESED